MTDILVTLDALAITVTPGVPAFATLGDAAILGTGPKFSYVVGAATASESNGDFVVLGSVGMTWTVGQAIGRERWRAPASRGVVLSPRTVAGVVKGGSSGVALDLQLVVDLFDGGQAALEAPDGDLPIEMLDGTILYMSVTP